MNISTIIPVYKNKEMTLRNLEINFPYIKETQIIIIDDASHEGIEEDIQKKYPSIMCITNQTNKGFGGTVNVGLSQATGDCIFLLNTDVVLRDDSYKKALPYFQRDEKLFAVSFMQVEKDGKDVGKNAIFFRDGFYQHSKVDDTREGLNGWAEGGACIIRASFFKSLGGFSDMFVPFYFEDNDLSYRAYKKGWHVLFTPEIVVEHHHESTIGKYFSKEHIQKIALRNQFLFFWGNIDDIRMWMIHLYKVVFFLLKSVVKSELWIVSAFGMALVKIPSVITHRMKKGTSVIKDKQIFALFT